MYIYNYVACAREFQRKFQKKERFDRFKPLLAFLKFIKLYRQPPHVLQFPEHFLLDCPVAEYIVPA